MFLGRYLLPQDIIQRGSSAEYLFKKFAQNRINRLHNLQICFSYEKLKSFGQKMCCVLEDKGG